LRDFLSEFRFDYVGVFPYSREEGTPAWAMTPQVGDAAKERRAVTLMNLQRRIAEEKNRGLLGRRVRVLVDGPAEEDDMLLEGRMETQARDIDGRVLIPAGSAGAGEFVTATLEQCAGYDFIAEIAKENV